MRSTNTHPGSPFAAVTAAGFVALARGNAPREGEEALRIVWDWDERTSRGARRRAVMHLVGLALGPGDFAPGRIEADFDEDGHPVGAYYANDWELTSASELLRAVGDLDSGERVLIALWDRGHGFVAVIEGGEEYVDIGSREALEGVSWSPATSEAEPRWISGRRDRRGVSLVMLDTHPPKDPGNNADTAGLRGLCDALDDLLYECPFDVLVRDYAEQAAHPPGDELTPVLGLRHQLARISEITGTVTNRERTLSIGRGPFDWFLLRAELRSPIGNLVRVEGGTLVSAAAVAGDATWEMMRDYGVVGGFDRVVIIDHDYSVGREQQERAALFASKLPEVLVEHNHFAAAAVRRVGAQALDSRLQDLHAVWDTLARWEGPVREDAGTDEFIRAYAASGADWPRRQSKSSPTIIWIGETEGNRPPGYLEGLAAAYHADRDLLEVNADFPVFRALQLYWIERYVRADEIVPASTTPQQINQTVADVVREWCEQTLVEVVVGVNQLAGRPGWDEARVRAALSPEALSGAALAIHHVQQSIKRSLGQRLGSLKEVRTM